MPRFKHDAEHEKGNHERWLLTYSDMITLLLVLFIVMYTMSTINSQKFKALADQMVNAFKGKPGVTQSGGNGNIPSITPLIPDKTPVPSSSPDKTPDSGTSPSPGKNNSLNNDFLRVYELIKKNITDKGYQDKVMLERGDTYILVKFKDAVLFYGDSYVMRPEGIAILKYISDTLVGIDTLIQKVQIEGYTAKVGPESKDNFFAWELSANRAIAVLKFMVQKSSLSQEKMSIAGYSHYVPIADNDTEQGRALNRRVEIKITQVQAAN